jgi:hypothetical protein
MLYMNEHNSGWLAQWSKCLHLNVHHGWEGVPVGLQWQLLVSLPSYHLKTEESSDLIDTHFLNQRCKYNL